jgi:hypothetical protein
MKKNIYLLLLIMSCSLSVYADDASSSNFDDGDPPPVEDPTAPPVDDNEGPPVEDPPPPAPINQWIPLLMLAGFTFIGYKTLSGKQSDNTSE